MTTKELKNKLDTLSNVIESLGKKIKELEDELKIIETRSIQTQYLQKQHNEKICSHIQNSEAHKI